MKPKRTYNKQVEGNKMSDRYTGKDNYGKLKSLFLDKLKALSDEELRGKCEEFIWLSAYANNNPRSDYHWQCDACYDEATRRGNPDIYSNAYEAVSQGVG